MRKVFSVLLKAAISGLLLYFALDLVDIAKVGARLSRINPGWIALALLVLLVQTLLLTLRWRQIVAWCGAELALARLFRFNMIGVFFNQTLPSSVGGDAVRLWLVAKQTNWRIATYSVFLDRVVGVFVLAAIVTLCLPWTLALVHHPVGRVALLVIGVGSITAGLGFISLGFERWRILQNWTVTRHLAASAGVALAIMRSPRSLATILGLSALIHLLTVLTAWCIARSIHADLSLLYSLFVVLPVILVAIVPISIAGWGVREGAMVAAFTYAGLPQSDGLLVSLLFGACYLALGAIGGVVWVLTGERANRSMIPGTLGRE